MAPTHYVALPTRAAGSLFARAANRPLLASGCLCARVHDTPRVRWQHAHALALGASDVIFVLSDIDSVSQRHTRAFEICFRYANTNPASLSRSCYFSPCRILSLDHPRSARSRRCSCTRARALDCRLSCALLRTHALLQIHMTNWCVWHDLIACVTWSIQNCDKTI